MFDIWHTSWSYEGARIHLAAFSIPKESIFALPASFPSSKCRILVVQRNLEWCFWCLEAGCLGSEIVYTLIFGCSGLLLLIDRIFLVRSGSEHDCRVCCR